jgi:ATP-dependent helicase YprA (DUF1998 family)
MVMHKTETGIKINALRGTARKKARDAKLAMKAANVLPDAREVARKLQEEADKAATEANALKARARLEDLHVWIMENTKTTKKGSRTYRYWMANWREDRRMCQWGTVRNVFLGRCDKMDEATALQKARVIKAKALGIAP